MSQALRRLVLLAGLVCALVATTAAPAPAASPCWKLVLNDWLDGRIDGLYPVACYRAAINHLPTDIETYSSARQDILRALQARIAGKHAPPNHDNQGGGGSSSGGGSGGGTSGGSGGSDSGGGGVITKTLDAGRPSSVDAVPLPLIVLSAIAGALLLLGGVGLIARRMQTRRPQMRPAESTSPNRNS